MITYIFPFSKIPPNSRILIYGLGDVGTDYIKQVTATGYCKITAVIDKRYKDFSNFIFDVYPYEKISTLEFDFIVVALKTDIHIDEIVNIIEEQGVPANKIIISKIVDKDIPLIRSDYENQLEHLAYEKSNKSINVLMDGGIGDCIARAPLIYALINEVPDCVIDISGVKNIEFVKFLFSECTNINSVLPSVVDGERYSLAFSGMVRKLTIDHFEPSSFHEYSAFVEKINVILSNSERADYSLPYYIYWKRNEYLGLDCYSDCSCGGVFDIDKNVHIPLTEQGKKIFEKYNLKNYITICTGNGSSSKGDSVAKSWPDNYFQELVDLIHRYCSEYKVIQIDSYETKDLDNADVVIKGESFEGVAWILKEAKMLISIEGGMVYLASQLGTKCAVLFGPTSEKYWGQRDNINISSHVCESCYGLYSDGNMCARGLKKPECMCSINPSYVFNRVIDFLFISKDNISS